MRHDLARAAQWALIFIVVYAAFHSGELVKGGFSSVGLLTYAVLGSAIGFLKARRERREWSRRAQQLEQVLCACGLIPRMRHQH